MQSLKMQPELESPTGKNEGHDFTAKQLSRHSDSRLFNQVRNLQSLSFKLPFLLDFP